MPTYNVKYRITHPIEVTTVDAPSREEAVVAAIALGDEGDEVEVMHVEHVVTEPPPPGADEAHATSHSRKKKEHA
jgi:hypothetical protein